MTPAHWTAALLIISSGILIAAILAECVMEAAEMPAREACGECDQEECEGCCFNATGPDFEDEVCHVRVH